MNDYRTGDNIADVMSYAESRGSDGFKILAAHVRRIEKHLSSEKETVKELTARAEATEAKAINRIDELEKKLADLEAEKVRFTSSLVGWKAQAIEKKRADELEAENMALRAWGMALKKAIDFELDEYGDDEYGTFMKALALPIPAPVKSAAKGGRVTEKEVKDKIGKDRWPMFLKWMDNQTVGINDDGSTNYYECDVEKFARGSYKIYD